ncbi:uncharacterized protein LOC143018209 isoform X3 [Oratosquilla oratoria]|uniref:uncharacterized protein LOC143018209 isoform X3 n=1 Tax=Oratosquilla oratoria TaxID=337810 RepID=UPI003F7725A8
MLERVTVRLLNHREKERKKILKKLSKILSIRNSRCQQLWPQEVTTGERAVQPWENRHQVTCVSCHPWVWWPRWEAGMVRRLSTMCTCHVSTAPSVDTNMNSIGIIDSDTVGARTPVMLPGGRKGAEDRLLALKASGGSLESTAPPCSTVGSRCHSRQGAKVAGQLAAQAFNLMVTVPQNISCDADGDTSPEAAFNSAWYEADVSDQSDSCLPPGTAKSAPSTPQTEQRLVPRPLPRHDTFIAPGVTPSTPYSLRPMKLKANTFSKNNRHALKSLSRSTPAMSPTGSPRQSDTETGPRSAKGTKKFHRHFTEAPPTERVLNYYACALLSEILLQGTLFITPNFFAFYSKIFGHVSKVLIPINQVSAIQKERTAKIIPNAVGLSTLDGKSYVFGSLLSRDSTYKLMNHMWKKTQKMVDSDSEPPSAQAEMADEAEEEEDSGSGSVESLLEEEEEEDEDKKERARPTTLPTWGGGGVGGGGVEVDSITPTSTNPPRGVQTSPVGPEIPVVNCTNPAASLGANPSACATPGRTSEVWGSGGKQRPEDQKISPEDTTVLSWFPIIWVFKVWCRVGSVPLRLVGQGLRELCALSRTSLLLLLSTLLLLLLFASASFMLHRVDILSRQMLQQDRHEQLEGMYEEVLRMQQRLHTAATTEVEKTLGVQLKHIATVRQSLEALAALFNREARHAAPQIQENT